MQVNVIHRSDAYIELAEHARLGANLRLAADYYLDAGNDINAAFRSGQARGHMQELRERRASLMQSYVDLVKQITVEPNEHIEVWLSLLKAMDCFVRHPYLVLLGCKRLESWWEAVMKRDKLDIKSSRLMEVQLNKIDNILAALSDKTGPDAEAHEHLASTRDRLHTRWGLYRDTLSGYSN